jgi:hypothetical protein
MDVRVGIVEPLVPRYRVAVFETLGRQPGLSLRVVAEWDQGKEVLRESAVGRLQLRHSPLTEIGPFIGQDE